MSSPADETDAERRRRATDAAVFIIGVAPPAGWTVFFLFLALVTVAQSGTVWLSGLKPFGAAVFIWATGAALSYLGGILAAGVAAAATSAIIQRYGTIGYGLSALVGALSGALNGLVWTAPSFWGHPFKRVDLIGFPLLFGAIGLAAGLMCRWGLARAGILTPGSKSLFSNTKS